MNGLATPLVEWAAVARPPPGGSAGRVHLHTVRTVPHGVLVALVESIGAAGDAPARAHAALAVVARSAFAPLPLIVDDCHRELRGTAGVMMSLALFDARRPVLWWLGVGHLPGYVMSTRRGSGYRPLPLHAGVIGQELPAVSTASVPLANRDTVIIVTDTVHWDRARAPGRLDAPSQVAKRLLDDCSIPGETAVVLAARYLGIAGVHAH